MISFDEASAILAGAAKPLGVEVVPLVAAAGRTLAAPCIAQVDSPPADVSAMDGYAVRHADLARSTRLRIVGSAFPGAPFDGALGAGETVRIFTGAPVPAGADRVVVQEVVTRDGDEARVDDPSLARPHIRPRGLDFRAGEVLLEAGRRLDARALVAAAGADLGEVAVWRRPRVALLSTGDELAAPGSARGRPGSIPESGSFGAAALAEAAGATIVDRRRLRDDLAEMTAGAEAALAQADLVVVTGGASVGEKDYARRVFGDLGADLLFAKVAMMPGKPVWFARVGERLVLGLPGNPTSAMVTARLFLAPLVAALGGRDPALHWRTMALAAPLAAAGDREAFVRARQEGDKVVPIANQDSGMQSTLADATLLIRRRPHAAPLAAGDPVEAIDF